MSAVGWKQANGPAAFSGAAYLHCCGRALLETAVPFLLPLAGAPGLRSQNKLAHASEGSAAKLCAQSRCGVPSSAKLLPGDVGRILGSPEVLSTLGGMPSATLPPRLMLFERDTS